MTPINSPGPSLYVLQRSHELLPLARQTASGSDQGIKISKTEWPSSRNWSGGNARTESAATARITRFSTAVHSSQRSQQIVREDAFLTGRNRLSLDDASLLFHLDELVRAKPPGNDLVGNPTDEHQEWVGRARALIGSWDAARGITFNSDCDNALASNHYSPMEPVHALGRMMSTIQEARSELRLITGGRVSAAFAAGQPFDVFDELRKVIETAQRDVLCVDRYMGADFVSRYMPHIPHGITTRLLTRDMVPQLTSALSAYKQQHSLAVEARTSQGFHGRFLCVDGARSFTVDASFKDAAKSAPAALIELTDTAAASLAQYEQLWQNGTKVF